MHYDLMVSARVALAREFESQYPIAYENVDFTPPGDGGIWLKFDYMEADTDRISLDRKCISYIGIVQVGIVFPPGSGTDKARLAAKSIAEFFLDGKMLDTGYIYSGGEVRPVQKSNSGWFIPVRFSVRFDKRGLYASS